MDSFFGIGMMELFFIALIALIVLGPERMPGAIREVMKTIRYVRNMSNELTSQFSEEFKGLDDLNPQKILQEIAGDLDEEDAAKKPAAAKKPTAAKPLAAKPVAKPAAPKPAAKPAPKAAPETSAAALKSDSDAATPAPAVGEPDASMPAAESVQTGEPDAIAAGDSQEQPERTILPPQTMAADETSPPAASPDEAALAGETEVSVQTPLPSAPADGAEPAGEHDPLAPLTEERVADDVSPAEFEPASATRRATLSVNGKGADPEGEG